MQEGVRQDQARSTKLSGDLSLCWLLENSGFQALALGSVPVHSNFLQKSYCLTLEQPESGSNTMTNTYICIVNKAFYFS